MTSNFDIINTMQILEESKSYEKAARAKLYLLWERFSESLKLQVKSDHFKVIPNYIWINHSYDKFAEDNPNGLRVEYAVCLKSKDTGFVNRFILETRVSNTCIESIRGVSTSNLYFILKQMTDTAIREFKSHIIQKDRTFSFTITQDGNGR